jgi:hypothetical protein
MSMMLPFVQLELSHTSGPAPGFYLVTPDGLDHVARLPVAVPSPSSFALFGVDREVSSADVLSLSVIGRDAARRARWIGRRRGIRAGAEAARPVPLLLATHALATRPLRDVAAADELMGELRGDRDRCATMVARALHVLNRALDAHRAAAGDCYMVEVAPQDPRAIRLGVATSEQIAACEWHDACSWSVSRAPKVSRGAALRPAERVAQVLAGRAVVLDAERHLLRARLDADQGRYRSAVGELDLALMLLGADMVDDAAVSRQVTDLRLRCSGFSGQLSQADATAVDDALGEATRLVDELV